MDPTIGRIRVEVSHFQLGRNAMPDSPRVQAERLDESGGAREIDRSQVGRVVDYAEGDPAGTINVGPVRVRDPNTVERHRQNIMSKLGLHNRAELVRYAISKGLVEVE